MVGKLRGVLWMQVEEVSCATEEEEVSCGWGEFW